MPSQAISETPPGAGEKQNAMLPVHRTYNPEETPPPRDPSPASGKTATHLLEMLRMTGSGVSRVERIQKHVDALPATPAAEYVLDWMILEGFEKFPLGTVQKVGKWLYGDGWDIRPHGVTANDELTGLREEVAALKRTVNDVQIKNAMYIKENQDLRARLDPVKAMEQLERIRGSTPLPVPSERIEHQEPETEAPPRRRGRKQPATV